MEENKVLVSICCVTYNHSSFIRQCLDGFFMQECNFNFEVLIHDDASTDNTQEIIKEYQEKYPGIIKPILQTENQRSKFGGGMYPRFNYPRAKGKYIAVCEGDDYWTDPLKLQKQVNLLENNPDCSMCFTDLQTYFQEEDKMISRGLKELFNPETKLNVYDIARKYYAYTATVMFKNRKQGYPMDLFQGIGGDATLYLLILEDGSKAIFLAEETTVYRAHSGGVFSGRDKFPYKRRIEIQLRVLERYDAWFRYFKDVKLLEIFKKQKFNALNKLRVIALENRDSKVVRSASKKLIMLFPMKLLNIKLWISILTSYAFPKLHGNHISKRLK